MKVIFEDKKEVVVRLKDGGKTISKFIMNPFLFEKLNEKHKGKIERTYISLNEKFEDKNYLADLMDNVVSEIGFFE